MSKEVATWKGDKGRKEKFGERGMASMSSTTSRGPNESLFQPSSPEKLAKILQCVVCKKLTSVMLFGTCDYRGHPICRPCYFAYLKEMDGNEEMVLCPVVGVKGRMCARNFKVWSLDKGTPAYWDEYLKCCNFRCSSYLYGCGFKGQGLIAIEHEVKDCEYSVFRKCQQKLKGPGNATKYGEFQSAPEFHRYHLPLDGHQCPGEPSSVLEVRFPLNPTFLYQRMPMRVAKSEGYVERIFTRLCQFAPGKYCIVAVDEGFDCLRAYVTKADASDLGGEDFDVTLVTPAKGFFPKNDDGRSTRYLMLEGKMSPFAVLRDKSPHPRFYFEIGKSFLHKYFKRKDEDEKWISLRFSIKAVAQADSREVPEKSLDSELATSKSDSPPSPTQIPPPPPLPPTPPPTQIPSPLTSPKDTSGDSKPKYWLDLTFDQIPERPRYGYECDDQLLEERTGDL